ncbi:MAG: membrane protein insertase YidC [Candidatus Campbellbacteria bacterium]|nr:membrane protein insertase YidC [Candidatus Campbellbacteria bacterium]
MGFFSTVIYAPIYNSIIFIISLLGDNIAIAMVVIPIIIKIILFPLLMISFHNQQVQEEISKKMEEIKKKYENNKEEFFIRIQKLFKEHNFHPFLGILSIILQIPIIITVSLIIIRDEIFVARSDLLYSFVEFPSTINGSLLNIDLSSQSLLLAVFAFISQYFLLKAIFSRPRKASTEQMDLMRKKMEKWMFIILPPMVAITSFYLSGAVALYWTATALVSILQEMLIFRPMVMKRNSNNKAN